MKRRKPGARPGFSLNVAKTRPHRCAMRGIDRYDLVDDSIVEPARDLLHYHA
jgi:hypothetical protein